MLKKNELKLPQNNGYEIIDVTTVKLSKILKDENITHIDFLSIDTEGSELDILKTIDFSKVYIYLIIIEDNYGDPNIITFFEERGYKFIEHIAQDKIFQKL